MKYTKTHCINGHEWNDQNTGWSVHGNYCKACAKDVRNRFSARLKEMRRKRYFDAVIPVWKACAEVTREATS